MPIIVPSAPGGNQFNDMVEPVGPMPTVGAGLTAALVANTVYIYRFRVARPITIANAKIWVGATPAGTCALGVYTESGGTWTRVAATADTAAGSGNAVQTIALTSAYTLIPDTDYWSSFGGTDATFTVLRFGSGPLAAFGAITNRMLAKAAVYSSGLPTSIVTPTGTQIPFWHVFTT